MHDFYGHPWKVMTAWNILLFMDRFEYAKHHTKEEQARQKEQANRYKFRK